MSKQAIQAVVDELESLPETDQRLVLEFLARLRQERCPTNSRGSGSELQQALVIKDGLLVFTGKLDAPDVDWVRRVRDERDEELMQATLGRTSRP